MNDVKVETGAGGKESAGEREAGAQVRKRRQR